MLSDIAALIIAFISVRMSPKSWHKNTYGWARAEVLGESPHNFRDRFL
jgi:zinc transporter 1